MQLTVGARLRSAVDETQVIVVRAPADPVDLTCGGHPLLPIDAEVESGPAVTAGHDGGTVLGKRYVDADSSLELLCTKGGGAALFLGDIPLSIKAAKALPASD
ncbi:hypothetical protein [Mycolicibacterium peregrinum]|uniref:hypothetical protein n=1 Tax=Mycolicibacterium peregrinum TaxID=43304 RepID=UPI003AAF421C